MNATIKGFLKRAFPRAALYWRAFTVLLRNEHSYVHSTGWMRSFQERRPVDRFGNVIPWMNYPVISFLSARLTNGHTVFEFGSGYSTLFYAQLVQSVTSVEYNLTWFQFVKQQAPENVTLLFTEHDIDGEYCRTIHTTGRSYNVVIIDGRDRVNCIKQSINALAGDGVMVLDDSQRSSYLEGITYAKAMGFRALDFEGLKPTTATCVRTTLLYRRDNCLDL